jgi:dihydroneopterin aldolase
MPDIRESLDRIFLRGLTTECIIGFIDWERRVKQTVTLDIELPVNCRRAAESDEVADTLDYKKVAKRVLAFVEGSEFKLVETLAHRLALVLLAEFALEWVRISLNKPGAIRHSRDVGVVIERTRADLARPRLSPRGRKPSDGGVRRRRHIAPEEDLARGRGTGRISGTRVSPWYRNHAVGFSGVTISLVEGSARSCPWPVLQRLHAMSGRTRAACADRAPWMDVLLYGNLVRDGRVKLPRPDPLAYARAAGGALG